MPQILKVRGFMPLAMVALALGACNGKDKDKDDTDVTTDQTDSDTTEESGDSGDDDGFFDAASASISFELAYNAAHELSNFSVDGNEGTPSMTITFTDVRQDTCTLLYQLDVAAFNDYLGVGDTDAPSAAATNYTDWLDTQALVAGQVIADGLYTGLMTEGCVLDPATWTADPHAGFLGGAWQMGWAAGVPDSVQTVVDDNGGLEAVFGADFDANKAIGGYTRVPADFFGPGGQRDLEAVGLVGTVNGAMEVQDDGMGNLVLIDAADTFGVDGPNAGYVRMFSLFGITFGG